MSEAITFESILNLDPSGAIKQIKKLENISPRVKVELDVNTNPLRAITQSKALIGIDTRLIKKEIRQAIDSNPRVKLVVDTGFLQSQIQDSAKGIKVNLGADILGVKADFKTVFKEAGQSLGEEFKGALQNIKLDVKGGGILGGLLSAATSPVRAITTGLFERVGANVSDNLGKGISQGIEKQLAPILGNTELVGQRIGTTLATEIVNFANQGLARLGKVPIFQQLKKEFAKDFQDFQKEALIRSRSDQLRESKARNQRISEARTVTTQNLRRELEARPQRERQLATLTRRSQGITSEDGKAQVQKAQEKLRELDPIIRQAQEKLERLTLGANEYTAKVDSRLKDLIAQRKEIEKGLNEAIESGNQSLVSSLEKEVENTQNLINQLNQFSQQALQIKGLRRTDTEYLIKVVERLQSRRDRLSQQSKEALNTGDNNLALQLNQRKDNIDSLLQQFESFKTFKLGNKARLDEVVKEQTELQRKLKVALTRADEKQAKELILAIQSRLKELESQIKALEQTQVFSEFLRPEKVTQQAQILGKLQKDYAVTRSFIVKRRKDAQLLKQQIQQLGSLLSVPISAKELEILGVNIQSLSKAVQSFNIQLREQQKGQQYLARFQKNLAQIDQRIKDSQSVIDNVQSTLGNNFGRASQLADIVNQVIDAQTRLQKEAQSLLSVDATADLFNQFQQLEQDFKDITEVINQNITKFKNLQSQLNDPWADQGDIQNQLNELLKFQKKSLALKQQIQVSYLELGQLPELQRIIAINSELESVEATIKKAQQKGGEVDESQFTLLQKALRILSTETAKREQVLKNIALLQKTPAINFDQAEASQKIVTEQFRLLATQLKLSKEQTAEIIELVRQSQLRNYKVIASAIEKSVNTRGRILPTVYEELKDTLSKLQTVYETRFKDKELTSESQIIEFKTLEAQITRTASELKLVEKLLKEYPSLQKQSQESIQQMIRLAQIASQQDLRAIQDLTQAQSQVTSNASLNNQSTSNLDKYVDKYLQSITETPKELQKAFDDVIVNMEKIIGTQLEQRPKLIIGQIKEGISFSGTSVGNEGIILNEKWISDINSFQQNLFIIIHEIFHTFQSQVIQEFKTYEDQLKALQSSKVNIDATPDELDYYIDALERTIRETSQVSAEKSVKQLREILAKQGKSDDEIKKQIELFKQLQIAKEEGANVFALRNIGAIREQTGLILKKAESSITPITQETGIATTVKQGLQRISDSVESQVVALFNNALRSIPNDPNTIDINARQITSLSEIDTGIVKELALKGSQETLVNIVSGVKTTFDVLQGIERAVLRLDPTGAAKLATNIAKPLVLFAAASQVPGVGMLAGEMTQVVASAISPLTGALGAEAATALTGAISHVLSGVPFSSGIEAALTQNITHLITAAAEGGTEAIATALTAITGGQLLRGGTEALVNKALPEANQQMALQAGKQAEKASNKLIEVTAEKLQETADLFQKTSQAISVSHLPASKSVFPSLLPQIPDTKALRGFLESNINQKGLANIYQQLTGVSGNKLQRKTLTAVIEAKFAENDKPVKQAIAQIESSGLKANAEFQALGKPNLDESLIISETEDLLKKSKTALTLYQNLADQYQNQGLEQLKQVGVLVDTQLQAIQEIKSKFDVSGNTSTRLSNFKKSLEAQSKKIQSQVKTVEARIESVPKLPDLPDVANFLPEGIDQTVQQEKVKQVQEQVKKAVIPTPPQLPPFPIEQIRKAQEKMVQDIIPPAVKPILETPELNRAESVIKEFNQFNQRINEGLERSQKVLELAQKHIERENRRKTIQASAKPMPPLPSVPTIENQQEINRIDQEIERVKNIRRKIFEKIDSTSDRENQKLLQQVSDLDTTIDNLLQKRVIAISNTNKGLRQIPVVDPLTRVVESSLLNRDADRILEQIYLSEAKKANRQNRNINPPSPPKPPNLPPLPLPPHLQQRYNTLESSIQDEQIQRLYDEALTVRRKAVSKQVAAIDEAISLNNQKFIQKVRQELSAKYGFESPDARSIEASLDKIILAFGLDASERIQAIKTSVNNGIRQVQQLIKGNVTKESIFRLDSITRPQLEVTRQELTGRIDRGNIAGQAINELEFSRLKIESDINNLIKESVKATKERRQEIIQEVTALDQLLAENKVTTEELKSRVKLAEQAQRSISKLSQIETNLDLGISTNDASRINQATKALSNLQREIDQLQITPNFKQGLKEIISLIGDRLPPQIKALNPLFKAAGVALGGFLAYQVLDPMQWWFNLRFAIQSLVTQVEKLEAAKIKIESFGGSLESALMIADKYKVSLDTVVDGYAQLTAATKGTNLEGIKTQKILESVAQSSRVFGLSAEDTSGFLLAMRQILSGSTLQLEELNQISERLPGALSLSAKAMRVTTGELRDLTSAAAVSSEEFAVNFAEQLKIISQTGLPASLKSIQSERTQMINEARKLQFAVGKEFQAGILFGIEVLTGLAKAGQVAAKGISVVLPPLAVLTAAFTAFKLPSLILATSNALNTLSANSAVSAVLNTLSSGFASASAATRSFITTQITLQPLVVSATASQGLHATSLWASNLAIKANTDATVLNSLAAKGANLVLKAHILLENLLNTAIATKTKTLILDTVAQKGRNLVTLAGVGVTRLATLAIKGFNLAIAASPVILLIGAVKLLTDVWGNYREEVNRTNENLKAYQEQLRKASEFKSETFNLKAKVEINKEEFQKNLNFFSREINKPFGRLIQGVVTSLVRIPIELISAPFKLAFNSVTTLIQTGVSLFTGGIGKAINTYFDGVKKAWSDIIGIIRNPSKDLQNIFAKDNEGFFTNRAIIAQSDAFLKAQESATNYYNFLQKLKNNELVDPEQITQYISALEFRNEQLRNEKGLKDFQIAQNESEIKQNDVVIEQLKEKKDVLEGTKIRYAEVAEARKKASEAAKKAEADALYEIEKLTEQGAITSEKSAIKKQQIAVQTAEAELKAQQEAQAKIKQAIEDRLRSEERKRTGNLTGEINLSPETVQAIKEGNIARLKELRVDPKLIEDIEKAQTEITELEKKATLDRIKLAQMEKEEKERIAKKAQDDAVKSVEEEYSKVNDKIQEKEQERIIAIKRLRLSGGLNEAQASEKLKNSTKERLDAELKAEEDNIKKIEQLQIESGLSEEDRKEAIADKEKQLSEARKRYGEIQINLLDNQIEKETELKETIENVTQAIEENKKAALDQLSSQNDLLSQQLDLLEQAINRSKELSQLRFDLATAQNNLLTGQSDIEIQKLERAKEILKELRTNDELTSGQQKALRQELVDLGINGKTSELELTRQINQIEEENRQRKFDALQREFNFKQQQLDIERQIAEIQARKEVLSTKNNLNQLRQSRLDAERQIREDEKAVKEAKTPQEKEAAQRRVELSKEQLNIVDEQIKLGLESLDANNKQIEDLKEINRLKQEQLDIEREIALRQEGFNNLRDRATDRNENATALSETRRGEIDKINRDTTKKLIEAQRERDLASQQGRGDAQKTYEEAKSQIEEEQKKAIAEINQQFNRQRTQLNKLPAPAPYFDFNQIYRQLPSIQVIPQQQSQSNEQIIKELQLTRAELKRIQRPEINQEVTINAETRDVDAIVRKAQNSTMDGLLSGLSRMGL